MSLSRSSSMLALVLVGGLVGCDQGGQREGMDTGTGAAEPDTLGSSVLTEQNEGEGPRATAELSQATDAQSELTEAQQQEGLTVSKTLSAEPNRLEVRVAEPFGAYLVDVNGRALYMFMADSRDPSRSTCTGDCVHDWPPMTADHEVIPGEGLDPDLIGRIEHPAGGLQVTYAGWPLYYYQQDASGATVAGQDLMSHGAEWYLLSPEGEPIKGNTHAPDSQAVEPETQPAE